MSDGGSGPHGEEGRPVEELASLREPVTEGFFDRLNRRINRRLLAGQVIHLGWYAPIAIFLEFVNMLVGLLGSASPPERGARGRE